MIGSVVGSLGNLLQRQPPSSSGFILIVIFKGRNQWGLLTRLIQVYSFVPIPGAQQHKRPRRRYEEIERMYKCGWNGCEKAYGTLNHLNAHVTMQAHGQKRTPEGKSKFVQASEIGSHPPGKLVWHPPLWFTSLVARGTPICIKCWLVLLVPSCGLANWGVPVRRDHPPPHAWNAANMTIWL